MTIGERIRSARKGKNLTQKQLGELCGIAEPTIRRYELNKLTPKIETLKKIATPLGISWYELYSDDPEQQGGAIIKHFLDKRGNGDCSTCKQTYSVEDAVKILRNNSERNRLSYYYQKLNTCGIVAASKFFSKNLREETLVSVADYVENLSKDQKYQAGIENYDSRLIAAFEKLNKEGQQKAVERVEELAEVQRYIKSDNEQSEHSED